MKIFLCVIVLLKLVAGQWPSINSVLNFVGFLNTDYPIFYNLYTRKNAKTAQTILGPNDVTKTNFDSSKMCVFVVHGWTQDSQTPIIIELKSTILQNYDANVFILDYSSISLSRLYPIVRDSVKPIGQKMGHFIEIIKTIYNINTTSILLVGFSLGAHICGNAGSITKIDRIVALDPAGPQFDQSTNDGLNTHDANYVEVIHTGGGGPGTIRPIGHVDYYVNGGMYQPGCSLFNVMGYCDHQKSILYFIESIRNDSIFEAVQCDTIEDFEYGRCENNSRSVMGGLIKNIKDVGSYYLKTNEQEPYALGAGVSYKSQPLAEWNIYIHNYFKYKGENMAKYAQIYKEPAAAVEKLLTTFV